MSWQERVLDGVRETSARTQRSGPRGEWIGLLLRLHPEMRITLRRVAAAKGMSMNTYVRRLIAMALVNEGSGSLDYWLPKMPAPQPPNGIHIHRLTKGPQEHDDGAGMEGMCTHPGCTAIHR